MSLTSGTYTITSDAYQKVARLPNNTLNTPVDLVAESGAENESWAIKTFADNTFTIKNKKFDDTALATSAISSGSKVTGGDGTHWRKEGSLITVSGLAWEATADGKILVKPKDSNNSAQAFTFASA